MILKQRKALEAAMSSSPEAEKYLRQLIREELQAARNRMVGDVPFKHGDPRGARHSIRYSVYKKILGGNVNIFRARKAGAQANYQKERKLDQNPHMRGGNRIKASANTKRIDSYGPTDRGFILNFINAGAGEGGRETRYGNRGAIAGTNWFPGSAQNSLEIALANLERLVEDELNNIVAKKMN